jgi:TolB protein
MEPKEGANPITISPHGSNQAIGSPAWSPDGSRIAYQVSQFPSLEGAILIVDAGGGTPDTLLSDRSMIAGLHWSPDGNDIVFSSYGAGSFDLWVLPVMGGEPVQITNSPANETQPKWSPDGARIAFISDLAGTMDIWTVSSTGGDWTQITFGPFGAGPLSWSPTGDAITFVLTRGPIENATVQDIAIQYLP